MKSEDIAELLSNELIDSFDPGYIKDVLECRDVLRKTGSDSLLWEDGELVQVLVEWKRKKS